MQETPAYASLPAQGRRQSSPGNPRSDDTMRKGTGSHGAVRTIRKIHETGGSPAVPYVDRSAHETLLREDAWTDPVDLAEGASEAAVDEVPYRADAAAKGSVQAKEPALKETDLADTWDDLDEVAAELGLSPASDLPLEALSYPDGAAEEELGEIPDLTGVIDAYRAEQAAEAAARAKREAEERRTALLMKAEGMHFGSDEDTDRMRRRIAALRRNSGPS